VGAYPQDENEGPNDRVLFNFCHLLKIGNAGSRPDEDILSKVILLVSCFAVTRFNFFWRTCRSPYEVIGWEDSLS